MKESCESKTPGDKNDGLKKKYGVMVLTAYGDAAKLTRQISGGGPTLPPRSPQLPI